MEERHGVCGMTMTKQLDQGSFVDGNCLKCSKRKTKARKTTSYVLHLVGRSGKKSCRVHQGGSSSQPQDCQTKL